MSPENEFKTNPVSKPSGPPDATVTVSGVDPVVFNLDKAEKRKEECAWLDFSGCFPEGIIFLSGEAIFRPTINHDEKRDYWIRLDFNRPVPPGTYQFKVRVNHEGTAGKVAGSVVVP